MVLEMEVAGKTSLNDHTSSLIDSWIIEYARDRIWRHFKLYGCSEIENIDHFVHGMNLFIIVCIIGFFNVNMIVNNVGAIGSFSDCLSCKLAESGPTLLVLGSLLSCLVVL
jgi:hypothetical protein